MCGIFAIFLVNAKKTPKTPLCKTISYTLRDLAHIYSKPHRYRGPEGTNLAVIQSHGVVLLHDSLSIVKLTPTFKPQPFKSEDGFVTVVGNGEIYNYVELIELVRQTRPDYTPASDINLLIELYEDYGEGVFQLIKGMYGFVLYDERKRFVIVGRDPLGILTVYMGKDTAGNFWISSEMKGLIDVCKKIKILPGGCMLSGTVPDLHIKKHFYPEWILRPLSNHTCISRLRCYLIESVRLHMSCNACFGVTLSGGFCSSLIASIATTITEECVPKLKLKTFSIALPDSCDLPYSRMVAKYLDSDHTEFLIRPEELLDCVRDVVYNLETYDENVIRKVVPIFLLNKKARSQDIKVLISGDGADDIFGGLWYDRNAPNADEFHHELVRRLRSFHKSFGASLGKACLSNGIELRAPFLDKDLVDYVMSIKPEEKIPGYSNTFGDEWETTKHNTPSKYILRCAFMNDFLPSEVLWREKVEIQDGIGLSWNHMLCKHVSSYISDEQMNEARNKYEINPPQTKEGLFYRIIFDEFYPCKSCACTVTPLVERTYWKSKSTKNSC